VYWVYWGVVTMLLMSYCSAAYVVVMTVESAISHTKGYYSIYSGHSTIGNYMGLFELLVVIAYLLWSFFTVILATIAGHHLWKMMDERLAESLTCKFCGELALSWDKGMRHFILSVIAGLASIIAAVALGDTADPVIKWFDEYDDQG
jgi:hypothetical protein